MPRIVGATTTGGWTDQTTLDVPSDARPGDLLLAWVSANAAPSVTAPDGWAPITSLVEGDLGDLTAVYLYSRRVAADEPGEHTWTWEGEHWHHGICVAVRGVEQVRAHAITGAEDVTSLPVPSFDALAGDGLVAFGFHWATDAGSEPDISNMATVAAQDTILVAAREAVEKDGPTGAHVCTAEVPGRMAVAAVLLVPTPAPQAPAWEEIPARRPLPPRQVWRYYAFRALSREWVHRELPLRDVTIEHTLSGPGALTASIEPTYADLIAPDGNLVLREWDTVIVAEAAGQLRGGGILTSMEITGDELSLDCVGFSGYAAGQPLATSMRWGGPTNGTSGNGVDAHTVLWHLWQHLQAQPDGDLGVSLDNRPTPYRMGAWHNARKLPTDDEPSPPATEVEEPPIPIDRVWANQGSRPAAATGKTLYWEYLLAWHEDIEIGAKFDEVCQQAGIDYRETWAWENSTREGVRLHLELGYPRLGKRQSGLRFVEGENISEVITLTRSGDDFANVVVGYGAGEGSKQLRQTASSRDGRLRRVSILDAEDIDNAASLRQLATDQLARSRQITDITGFVVRDHPNAVLGSFGAGDDVLVETVLGWQPTRMWVRILSYSYSPDGDTVDVTCARSDSFDYTRR